ncbi:hypothetical protein E4U55_007741 [Claviceps digitariae]|nr:hypothetical protein E4U55_007741 [Claviceps digitariae]
MASSTTHAMKITRSIPALERMVGTVASLDQHKALVRQDMKRILDPQERLHYRGITSTGAPWLQFEELFHVQTAEDVIRAEEFGAFHSPADYPDETYLYACEMGLVARMNPKRTAQLQARSAQREQEHLEDGERQAKKAKTQHHGSKKTREELHAQYKATRLGYKNWEELYDEVASDYVRWACWQG